MSRLTISVPPAADWSRARVTGLLSLSPASASDGFPARFWVDGLAQRGWLPVGRNGRRTRPTV
jgi:hypothetical protein